MKAFLAALCVMAIVAVASDYLLGGPLTDSGGVLIDRSAASVYSSPNVRLGNETE